MSQERITELEEILEWEWGTEREETYTWEEQKQNWIIQYNKLQKTPSTISKDPKEKRAGIWQNRHRQCYKKRKLTKERIMELEAILGWEWEDDRWPQQMQNWIAQYTLLQRPPSSGSKDKEEKQAGQWQSKLRIAYKKGSLSQERVAELEAIPGWTWSAK